MHLNSLREVCDYISPVMDISCILSFLPIVL